MVAVASPPFAREAVTALRAANDNRSNAGGAGEVIACAARKVARAAGSEVWLRASAGPAPTPAPRRPSPSVKASRQAMFRDLLARTHVSLGAGGLPDGQSRIGSVAMSMERALDEWAVDGDCADAARRRRLRRMRAVATGLLVIAGAVYLSTLHQGGFLGYVNAGAEASMVGAIADWFAVTALFRHPLGLPIPHTALIPRRKDDFGASLQDFFAENFLQEEVIRDRLAAADIIGRASRWLEVEENARRAVHEGATASSAMLTRLKPEDVQALVVEVLIPRLADEPISPIAGAFLAEVIADKAHHGFVDLVVDEGYRWLRGNKDTFVGVLTERAPWWAPDRLNEMVTDRLHLEALRWLEDIQRDPHHHARYALDSLLGQLAQDLLKDPSTQARAEALKLRLLGQPQMVTTGMSIWTALRNALLAALDEPDGPLRARAVVEVQKFARRLQNDDALRARFDVVLADGAVWTIDRYGDELSAIITHTIQNWDGKEAASKIELHVGPDLQFIRINGTIVGGLVGLLIHAVTVAVS